MRYSDFISIAEDLAYHGTASTFTSFAFRKSDSHPSKIGVWFTNDEEVARGFSKLSHRMVDDQSRVIKVDLRIQSPKIFSDYAAFLEMYRDFSDATKMRKALMRQGYDGIEITNSNTDGFKDRTDYAVFDKHQIDILSDEITEAFDSYARFQWEDHSIDGLRLIQAKFQIDQGLFVIQFKNPSYNPGMWELAFTRNETLDLTGTGNAAKVLSTVMIATREFIQSVNPRTITYSAKNDESSRNKLYPRLAAMLQKEFPQYISRDPKKLRTYTSYQLDRPDAPYVAPVAPPVPEHKPLTANEWADLDRFMDELQAEHRRPR